nr:MAG TPA: hypothetical protein [Caudoviricetes sp.]
MEAAVWPYFLFKIAKIRPPPVYFDSKIIRKCSIYNLVLLSSL